MSAIPSEVRQAYDLPEDDAALELQRIPSLINSTYLVRSVIEPDRAPLVLQRLHPVFGPEVHLDIEAVTRQLAARQLVTPQLIRARGGELWVVETGNAERRIWRALSYVDGVTVHQSHDPRCLESAAGLLGRFHAALADFDHDFLHQRPLHDTERHLATLRATLASSQASADPEAQRLGAEILRHADGLRSSFGELPRRVVHGDPKLSNVMFERADPSRALCMIDLDTVGRGPLAHELGDALRSWCNPAGEDTRAVHVDTELFRAVMRGYVRTCPADVQTEELLSAIDGFETISLELASRFAADVILDTYWGWDETRFASRREHNLLRARAQLALSQGVREARAELLLLAERELESSSARAGLGAPS